MLSPGAMVTSGPKLRLKTTSGFDLVGYIPPPPGICNFGLQKFDLIPPILSPIPLPNLALFPGYCFFNLL